MTSAGKKIWQRAQHLFARRVAPVLVPVQTEVETHYERAEAAPFIIRVTKITMADNCADFGRTA